MRLTIINRLSCRIAQCNTTTMEVLIMIYDHTSSSWSVWPLFLHIGRSFLSRDGRTLEERRVKPLTLAVLLLLLPADLKSAGTIISVASGLFRQLNHILNSIPAAPWNIGFEHSSIWRLNFMLVERRMIRGGCQTKIETWEAVTAE